MCNYDYSFELWGTFISFCRNVIFIITSSMVAILVSFFVWISQNQSAAGNVIKYLKRKALLKIKKIK